MSNKHKHLRAVFPRLVEQAEDCVLATIVETMGSTYQKAGSRMLITRSGELIGILGGGCFEHDLLEQARSVFESSNPKMLFYDMRAPAEVVWGLGLGCNGAVRIYLQLLRADENYTPLNYIVSVNEQKDSGVLITVCESEHTDYPVGSNYFLANKNQDAPLRLSNIPFPFTSSALQVEWLQKPRLEKHILLGKSVQAFYEWVQPAFNLLVLGAGIDAYPLVECAKNLGWQVSIVDYRPAYLTELSFPRVDRKYISQPESLPEIMQLNNFNAAVVMTHNFEMDGRYLKSLASSSISYLGVLGPAIRKDRLLNNLGGDATKLSNRIHGPVGLNIGAETPEEIALSIMAEIQAELRGYKKSVASSIKERTIHVR